MYLHCLMKRKIGSEMKRKIVSCVSLKQAKQERNGFRYASKRKKIRRTRTPTQSWYCAVAHSAEVDSPLWHITISRCYPYCNVYSMSIPDVNTHTRCPGPCPFSMFVHGVHVHARCLCLSMVTVPTARCPCPCPCPCPCRSFHIHVHVRPPGFAIL
jgi:hypothetical protein